MRMTWIALVAALGFGLAACTTTEERIGGAAVGAAVAGPVGAGVGVLAGPEVVDQAERSF
jgi:osmotically inducible lipoprotein OsmB